jgi:hypothetical protein
VYGSFLTKRNYKYIKGHQWKKSPSKNQLGHPSIQLLDNPNLQEPEKNNDGSDLIPTIVNGVISVNPNPNHQHIDSDLTSDSTTHLVNNLRDSINVLNKTKRSSSSKPKIVLVGDSHIKGYVSTLKPLLNSDYDLHCVVKPRSGTSELNESAKKV